MAITNTDFQNIALAISAYSDEAYTTEKKLNSTGIVAADQRIDASGESFIGQFRWYKPLNANINIASLNTAANGTYTDIATDVANFVKTVRTFGAEQVNMQEVISKQNGLAKIGRDFAETRSQDEHNGLLAVLKGVAISEAINGAAAGSGATGLGGQTFDNDPTDKKYGFYVDLGAAKPIVAATTSIQGAARAEGFLNAFGQAYKDYEPEYAYLVTSPEVLASMRSANLVDQTKVTEGNINFDTIFGGKFRIIQTRAAQGLTSAELTKINTGPGVDIVGTKTSFIVLPGAIAMQALAVPDQVELYRDANAYKGGGTTSVWYRWGYVLHPAGYNWAGSQEKFPSDAEYMFSVSAGTPSALASATSAMASTTGTWTRKMNSALSLGILPVFHS